MGPPARFKRYEVMIQPYSGLDPVNWNRFLQNLREFETTLAVRPLYEAVGAIKDLGAGSENAHILARWADQLGYEGEVISSQFGIDFTPRYLNDTLIDYPENVDWKPYRVRSHGQ